MFPRHNFSVKIIMIVFELCAWGRVDILVVSTVFSRSKCKRFPAVARGFFLEVFDVAVAAVCIADERFLCRGRRAFPPSASCACPGA